MEQGNVAKKLTGQILENWLLTLADGHGGIQTITKTGTSGLVDTYTIAFADETTSTFTVTNGRSISGLTTSKSGKVTTITITYNDNTTSSFTVRDGENVSSITEYWAVSTSGSQQPQSGWQTTPPTLTATYKYLWHYSKYTFSDGTNTSTTPAVQGVYGDKGDTGNTGTSITSVTKTGTSGLVDTYTITFSNGTTTTFNVTNGSEIESIEKTSTAGLVDTYTVTMGSGDTHTFTVTNGRSIVSFTQTSGTHAAGTIDVYTMTYNDGDTSQIQVYNGANGTGAVSTVAGIGVSSADGDVPLIIRGYGAPTTATVGQVNQLYFDMTGGIMYICIASAGGSYDWRGMSSAVDSAMSTTSANPLQNRVISNKVGVGSLSSDFTATNLTDAANELQTNKANLASPTFTGTPKAPTAAAGTNNTQLATTAFVQNIASDLNGALNTQSYIYPDLYGAKYDGVTDCTTIIQQVINESVTKGKIVRFTGTGTALISAPLNLPSKAHIKLDPQFTLKMADNSNCPMFVNSARDIAYDSPSAGVVKYYDNVIEGGTLNLNGDNQTFNNQVYKNSAGIVLTDIENFVLQNIRIVDPITFATLLSGMNNFRIENVFLDYSNQHNNMDGIHLGGNCTNGIINNIYGTTNDDMIALNPGDTLPRYASLRIGEMSNITVSNIYGENAFRAVRLLSDSTSPMRNMVIDGIYGSYQNEAVIFSTYTETTDAIYEDIVITNVQAEKFGGNGIIYFWANYNNQQAPIHAKGIRLSNIAYTQKSDRALTFMAVASYTNIEDLYIDSVSLFTDDINLAPKYFITGAGVIRRLFVSNCYIAKPSTQNKCAGFGSTTIYNMVIENAILYITTKYNPISSLNEVNVLINDVSNDSYSQYHTGDVITLQNGYSAMGVVNSDGDGFGAYLYLPKSLPGNPTSYNISPNFFGTVNGRKQGLTITGVSKTGENQLTITGKFASGQTDSPTLGGVLNLTSGTITI